MSVTSDRAQARTRAATKRRPARPRATGRAAARRKRPTSTASGRAPSIELRGVRVHNLQGIDVAIPRNRMTVISGVSGSGKSSLAFDTLYAEGRRRYVECLSTYTQQFLERTARPDLDAATGLPPAVAIERAVPAAQARSTVGTTTEIHDYLRLLFARVGRTYCVDCGRPVLKESPSDIARTLTREGGRAMVLFEADPPSRRIRWKALLDELQRDGFVRVWQEGEVAPIEQAAYTGERFEVVVDRLVFDKAKRTRIAEAVETAYRFGHDRCVVRWAEGRTCRFSRRLHCPDCDREYREPEPRLFSPNSPLGACPDCEGFGRSIGPDFERIIPDDGLTLADGPVDPWNKPSYREAYKDLRRAGRKVGLRWDVPYRDLPRRHRRLVEEGGQGFYGIRGFFEWLEGRTYRVHVRVFLARYRAYRPCPGCAGTKLRPEALAVRIGEMEMGQAGRLPVHELLDWVEGLKLRPREREVAEPIVGELRRRLGFLVETGLGYLTLERPSRTLSGGEAQRIQLARSLGSSLVDTLYVLDEPSVGLHPQDVDRLLGVLRRLRDMGNTVVVVEHDPRVIREADWLIDLGPGAGAEGGQVLYQGPVRGLPRARDSLTRAYLTERRRDAAHGVTRAEDRAGWIRLEGASVHNLRDLSVRIPRQALSVVTGVSGSGKSSLIHDTLHGALSRALGGPVRDTGPYRSLKGVEGLEGVELVDQSPIGKSPRSNPVTYVKAFDGIRKRLAATTAARSRGLKPGYFSFNIPGGRCDACEGAGAVLIEMHFLPDILVPCESCGGSRFGPGALRVRDRGRNVAQILELTVREALQVYGDVTDVAGRLRVLDDVGLGYLRLGQPAPTLSGGEAQRLKLAAHLRARGVGPRVFLLDEPTTGLHLHDVAVLVRLLRRLVEVGHTIVVVEHHLELVREADWIIDLGPGAGDEGGRLVAQGPPREVARSNGPTGRYLARVDSIK
jgi:excinuclease ABC subunit A